MAGIIGSREDENGNYVTVIDESIPDPIPMVGIFYFIDNEVLFDAIPVTVGKPHGDSIQYSSHYDFWNSLVPKTDIERRFKAGAYDTYPRGRVVFFPEANTYRIYFDDQCICFSDDMPFILDCFGLGNSEIEFLDDESYRCAGCNP